MQGSSRAALEAASARLDALLTDAASSAPSATSTLSATTASTAETAGQHFWALTDALDATPALRRSLTDPSLPTEVKQALAAQISAHAEQTVTTVFTEMAGARWSADADLPDATEHLGIEALLDGADARGALPDVEAEVFGIVRALQGQGAARDALSDAKANPEARAALISTLLDGKADPATEALATRVARTPRGQRFIPALLAIAGTIADRRKVLTAQVISAIDLTDAQKARLESLFTQHYGQPVQAYVTVDPTVVGGLRVQVGSDVIDTTVLTRIADARRAMAA
ncbi:MAG: F0F1 ATP synthase subunit delta [Cellulomonadaceae bacterium]|jgi:F-type H+-transporting ATPase subunit delta|nr:F0F1 ATP synthase subunit delta [Cellulomonadaceae bacterium]